VVLARPNHCLGGKSTNGDGEQ
jgi:glutathione synthase/RimK-type ligase-like ATP-grasp enzyme